MTRLYDPLTYKYPRTVDEAFPNPIERARWAYKEAEGFSDADHPLLIVAVVLVIATVAVPLFK